MFNQSSSQNSAQYATQHTSAEQYDEYKRGHDLIARNLADLMIAGCEISSTHVQEWIGKHYEYVCQFWTPNRIAYKSLALTYTIDPAFKATYESFEPGLALFIQKAIYIWADYNLDEIANHSTKGND
jgi:MerR family transcriptional regulator, thiopeptide resistance regulator